MLIGGYKSREVNLAAQFTWFLMVSYGLSVLAKHGNSTCLNDLLGLLLVIGAAKSQGANLAARFTWFLVVSYGVPVVANRDKSMRFQDLPSFR